VCAPAYGLCTTTTTNSQRRMLRGGVVLPAWCLVVTLVMACSVLCVMRVASLTHVGLFLYHNIIRMFRCSCDIY
jgi:hypothetical protein